MTAEAFCLRRPGGFFEKSPPGPLKNFFFIIDEKPSFFTVKTPTQGRETQTIPPPPAPLAHSLYRDFFCYSRLYHDDPYST
jgi:hypothetical protein